MYAVISAGCGRTCQGMPKVIKIVSHLHLKNEWIDQGSFCMWLSALKVTFMS